MPKAINNLEQLKKISLNGADFYIALRGRLRSSKHIRWIPESGIFWICNMIDGSEQDLTEGQIMDPEYTNIGEALRMGALFLEG